MEKKKIGLKEALENDGKFLAFLGQEARSDEYRRLREKAEEKRAHPTGKDLRDYAQGQLDKSKTMEIRKHVSFCGFCADEALKIMGEAAHPKKKTLYDHVLGLLNEKVAVKVKKHISSCKLCAGEVSKIMRIEDALNADFVDWANEPVFEIANEPVFETGILANLIIWASEFWEPQWAGQPVTASDIPEQEHSFAMDHGRIELSCYWEPQYEDAPAYMQLSWRANINMPCELWAKFVNPETEETLSEIGLGTYLEGREIFTSDQLEFDPSTERWAISIMLCEEGE